ncbi:transposase [Mesorhizobium sp. CU2]|uniref:transposase n=1 Tax=unclassified Mesorhizobium TaxID=325217 RepID=UPI00112AD7B2|nr:MULTISPECIES: transposase [unclassified Mesorhizobium]TPN84281.1 transposase [Mesorhizobium sp. CU3]TPO03332.1 transposase [Mesorhizobium sp. CU2]
MADTLVEIMTKKARKFSREEKVAAVMRMLAGENVTTLSAELNVLRKDLYRWRATFMAGGPPALRGPGRPPAPHRQVKSGAGAAEALQSNAHRRIAELERKFRRQQFELEAIRKALQQFRRRRNDLG